MDKPPRFSSLRVVREIEPTIQVAKFVDKVGEIGLQTFGAIDQTYVRDRVSRDEALRPGFEATQNILPISAATVYAKNSLRLTLLERRTPPHTNMGGSFERAKSWLRRNATMPNAVSDNTLTEAQTDVSMNAVYLDMREIEDQDTLQVSCVSVQRSINPDYEMLGPEYALTLDTESPVTEYLCDEANFVYNSVKSMPKSTRIVYPQSRSGLEIAFARIPRDASYLQRVEFVGRVIEECLPLDVQLGPRTPFDV